MKSLKFKLQIQCDNAAFADEPGINGNLVGECSLKAVRVQS